MDNKEIHSGTFVVRVTRRSGETWYGNIRSAECGKNQKFQNVQELLESMDNLLSSSGNSL